MAEGHGGRGGPGPKGCLLWGWCLLLGVCLLQGVPGPGESGGEGGLVARGLVPGGMVPGGVSSGGILACNGAHPPVNRTQTRVKT